MQKWNNMENIWIFMGMQWDFMYFYGKFNFFSLKIADFLI
tara:strand:- start:689 stop:808 length:120 start_codon:yes stop_codon:yes gene_type:complete